MTTKTVTNIKQSNESDDLDYYGNYPFKGYKTQVKKSVTSKLKKKPSLNPKVIWKHLRYEEI